jgi:hypothetical protein
MNFNYIEITVYFPAPPNVFYAFVLLTAVMTVVWVAKFFIRLATGSSS